MRLPTSLYIHIPWCIRKCPYCDFNSHQNQNELPEVAYINALLADFSTDLALFPTREITSIFIGGGTPSLFSAQAYASLFSQLQVLVPFAKDIEITLEANPGTVEQQRFYDYRKLGINRLSLGIQSFNVNHLKSLGRIHDAKQAHLAIETARHAGFDNLNLDLMYGLPKQSLAQGLEDLQIALSYQPEHLSWYQLTIEPNTHFYKRPPRLPHEDETFLLEEQGLALLAAARFNRYEISAFCQQDKIAQHNLNYWLFGDYYGIGAGAHGKISLNDCQQIYRTTKRKQPRDYLAPEKSFTVTQELVTEKSLLFEFMLNTTRLEQAIPYGLFHERTGLALDKLSPLLQLATNKGLIQLNEQSWQVTSLGRRYTNDLQALFLPV